MCKLQDIQNIHDDHYSIQNSTIDMQEVGMTEENVLLVVAERWKRACTGSYQKHA